jgi:CRP/FNR family transcriptional regulator
MSKEELTSLSDSKKCIRYGKGQYIFHEGSMPYGVYCVNDGKIKVSKIGDTGKEQILRLVKSGDVLGYRSLLANEMYNASAVAMEDSSICFIPRETFTSMVDKSKTLSKKIIELLSHNLSFAEDQIVNIAQKSVRERVAETILLLRETYGYEADNATLNLTLTRDDIANLVGTATESVIRMLSEFNKEGLVELKGKKIKILDQVKLLHIANLYN